MVDDIAALFGWARENDVYWRDVPEGEEGCHESDLVASIRTDIKIMSAKLGWAEDELADYITLAGERLDMITAMTREKS
jgi:hypothetical protein